MKDEDLFASVDRASPGAIAAREDATGPGPDAAPKPADGALEDRLAAIAEIDRELEAAIEYKLATGEEAICEILDMFARAVERRRLGLGREAD